MKKITFSILLICLSAVLFHIKSQPFVEQTGISLTGVQNSSVVWGDYDNDNDLDILLTGYTGSNCISRIYCNNGNNTFTDKYNISLPGIYNGSVAWGIMIMTTIWISCLLDPIFLISDLLIYIVMMGMTYLRNNPAFNKKV